MRDQPYRVIQWFTGDIACHQIRLIADHPNLELVGAFVWHDEKVGRDAGEIAGIDPLGVIATNDIDEILAVDADVVLYNPPRERYDEVVKILASGKSVISIMGAWNPKRYEVWPELKAAMEAGGSSLHGTGLNPGLSYELAILGSSVCHEVESIEVKTCERQSTMSPVFIEKFGFGRTEEDLRAGEDGAAEIFENLLQITNLICEEVGLPHDDAKISFEYEPATKRYDEKFLIEEGTMAGLVIKAQSLYQGVPKATVEVRFLIGTGWVSEEFLAAAPSTGWIEVKINGTPQHRFFHEMLEAEKIVRTRSTGTKAINAIPLVVEADPGLVLPTMTRMPSLFA
ncbi:MAG: hypothetical protein P8J50_17365 [Acidimicrobiales bacterium]|jgi:hypothetical protein|nr:hypothetical protein [Acidimicrobiales bacterium]